MTKRKKPKVLTPAWDVEPGYFTAPVRAWWPGWKSETTAAERQALRSSRTSSATTHSREQGLRSGEWWASGYLGQMSATPSKVIDVHGTRAQTIVGVRHTPSVKTRPKTAKRATT